MAGDLSAILAQLDKVESDLGKVAVAQQAAAQEIAQLGECISANVAAIQQIRASLPADVAPALDASKGFPYRSQWEPDAMKFTGDCGPACLAMIIQHATGKRVPIDDLSVAAGMGPDKNATIPTDLVRVGLQYGVTLSVDRFYSVRDTLALPAIVLVNYARLERLDTAYIRGHWIVVFAIAGDMVRYHDPDWWGTRMMEGADISIPVLDLDTAMLAESRRQGIVDADGKPVGLVIRLV